MKEERTTEFYDGDDDPYAEMQHIQRIKDLNRSACVGMLIFLMFLTVFTAVVLAGQSESSSRFVDRVRSSIEDGPVRLDSVTNIDTYWHFVEHTIFPAVYPNNTDTQMALSKTESLRPLDIANRLMGGIRIRQVRVKNTIGCQVGGLFEKYKTTCYPEYNEVLSESSESFGPKKMFKHSGDPGGSVHSGRMGEYSPNGFMTTFPTNMTVSLSQMRQLRDRGFLDPATRAVFVDFTVWNSNLGLYAVTRITHEFAPSGAVIGTARVLILAERYFTPGGRGTTGDWLQIIGEILIILFVLWYIAEELSELSVSRWEYLKDGWNLMDWINMFLLLYAFGSRMVVYVDSVGLTVGEAELNNKNSYTNLQPFAEQIEQAALINSFNAVLLWAKVFKFTGYVPYIKILINAIGGSFILFMSFLCMFVIAFIGFVISYNIGFGDKIMEFSTFHGAAIYLARSFLGDVDLLPVYKVSPLFGAILILLFYVMIMMVGLNVFFAILTNALHEAKYERSREQEMEDDVVTQTAKELYDWIMKTLDCERRMKTHAPALYKKVFKKGKGKGEPVKKKTVIAEPQVAADKATSRSSSSSTTSSTSVSSLTSWDARQKPVSAFKAREVMASVEHMAGRILSRIQGMGIEIRSEVLDIYEKMVMMDMAVGELTRRAKNIETEQVSLMNTD